ncbi:MAG: hypothetical protein Q8P30_04320, partial [Candidatus Uhrbacteria bacterium]|nr:hypothetical protein [Candidatus Uhrbacteria bacterium]
MHFAILLLVFLLYAVLAWRDIRVALVLLAGLLPIYLLRFSILGLPTTALEVLILICVAVWLIKHKGGKVRPRDFGPWFRPMLLLLAASTISTAIAPHLYDALGIWKAYFIEPVLVFVMLRDLFEKSDWMRAMKALAISGIIVSCFAIFQYYTGLGIPTPWDIELRVTGFFDYPNALGLFLAPIISACAVLLTSPIPKGRLRGVMAREGWGVVIAIITALLGSIAIILAQTEAAFVAIPVALILTLMFSSAGTKTKKRVALEALAIIILLTLAVPSVRSKIFLQDYSGQVRISQWSETVTMLADTPKYLLLGTG